MTANKRVGIAYVVTIGVLLFHVLDVFFLHSSLPLLSTNIFARILGLILLIVFSGFLGFNLKKFCFKSYGWFFEVLYGFFFSLVPIFVIYLGKYIYFLYRGYENLTLSFRPSGFGDYDGSKKYLINVLVYVITLFFYNNFFTISFFVYFDFTSFRSRLNFIVKLILIFFK